MEMSEQVDVLAKALSKAQGEMGGAVKDSSNPFFKSSYADLGSVIAAIKDSFAANGLSYTQFPIRDEAGAGVETILMHESGQWIKSSYTLPLAKFDAQSAGSCLTYARRYALQAIAGIPAVDDDGNQATASAPQYRPAPAPAPAPQAPLARKPKAQKVPEAVKEEAGAKNITVNGKQYGPLVTCKEINDCIDHIALEQWKEDNIAALKIMSQDHKDLNGIITAAFQARKKAINEEDIPF
jgi:hypothetical protein